MTLGASALRHLAHSCDLNVQVESGGADVSFSAAGGVTKGVSIIGLGAPPNVSEDEVLAAPERVVLTTASGLRCELKSPEVLEWVVTVLPHAYKFVAETLLKGSPVPFEVLPTHDGKLPKAMFGHDTHKAVLPREHVVAGPAGPLRLRIARCPDCQLFLVGEQ